jgi:AcrR family transcriptional regulator
VDATRKRILKTASRRFRKEGLEKAGIAELMKAAGLTHGGFYFHFASKEALVREAMNEAFDLTNALNEQIARCGEYANYSRALAGTTSPVRLTVSMLLPTVTPSNYFIPPFSE